MLSLWRRKQACPVSATGWTWQRRIGALHLQIPTASKFSQPRSRLFHIAVSLSAPFFSSLSSFFLLFPLILLLFIFPRFKSMNISKARIWINQPSPTTSKTSVHFLSLPKEILFEIISYATTTDDSTVLYPPSLIQLSLTCRYLHHLIHKDPWRLKTLWPRAFRSRFDTAAIVRRHLHRYIHWQYALEERCRVLYNCRNIAAHIVAMQASNAQQQELQHLQQQQQNLAQALDSIDWQLIWTIITEHGECETLKKKNNRVYTST